MAKGNGKKLNRLQRELPDGLLVDTAWLESRGYSASLRHQYVASGWLDRPARGVYRRPGGPLRWQHVVISLQTLLLESGRPVLAIGGRTALEMHGFAHYLSGGVPKEVHLYGDEPPPGWLAKLALDTRFVCHNARRLFCEQAGVFSHQTWGQWDSPLTLTPPERAVLELLDEVPKRESFHQVDMLMEGLTSLSPRRLHDLLVDCRNVKVKRLFLWYADRHNHAWLRHLELGDIDLGKGKRQIVAGGRFDSKYQITVPDDLDADR